MTPEHAFVECNLPLAEQAIDCAKSCHYPGCGGKSRAAHLPAAEPEPKLGDMLRMAGEYARGEAIVLPAPEPEKAPKTPELPLDECFICGKRPCVCPAEWRGHDWVSPKADYGTAAIACGECGRLPIHHGKRPIHVPEPHASPETSKDEARQLASRMSSEYTQFLLDLLRDGPQSADTWGPDNLSGSDAAFLPYATELLTLRSENAALKAEVQARRDAMKRIEGLHAATHFLPDERVRQTKPVCAECSVMFPCETFKALCGLAFGAAESALRETDR